MPAFGAAAVEVLGDPDRNTLGSAPILEASRRVRGDVSTLSGLAAERNVLALSVRGAALRAEVRLLPEGLIVHERALLNTPSAGGHQRREYPSGVTVMLNFSSADFPAARQRPSCSSAASQSSSVPSWRAIQRPFSP